MKTAFKILPLPPSGQDIQLIAEIGYDGISLLYYSNTPLQVEGWMNFQFEKNLPASAMSAEIENWFEKETLPPFTSCHIFFNFKESLLVPIEYFKEDQLATMLDCLYGVQPTDAVFSEPIESMQAVNVYRVNDELYNSLNNKFPSAVFYHSQTLLLPLLMKGEEELFCTIFQNNIRIILLKNGQVLFVQYFDYTTPADVAYQLLNSCTQHNISPADARLSLNGFIEKDSNLYEELYRYFLNIKLSELPVDIRMGEAVAEMPAHFFNHLTALAQCVS